MTRLRTGSGQPRRRMLGAQLAGTLLTADTDSVARYVKPALFRGIFAADLPPPVAAVMAAAQRFTANRAGSRVAEVSASHAAMTSRPGLAVSLIAAATATVHQQ